MNAIIEVLDREIAERAGQLDKLREAREVLAEALLSNEARHTPSRPSSTRSSGSDRSRGKVEGGTCSKVTAGGCSSDIRTAACDICGEAFARCGAHNNGRGSVSALLTRHRDEEHDTTIDDQ